MNSIERKIRDEIKEEMDNYWYEREKEKYREIIKFETIIKNKYHGIDSMYNIFAPKIELIIEELLKNNEYSISRVELLKKIGITEIFDGNKVNKYEFQAYSNLLCNVIERMGYKQSEKVYLIYTFYKKYI